MLKDGKLKGKKEGRKEGMQKRLREEFEVGGFMAQKLLCLEHRQEKNAGRQRSLAQGGWRPAP